MEKKDIAIRVKDLKKNFKVYIDKSNSMKEKLLFFKRRKHELRQVLKGVSFEIPKGQAVGLVGRNGCGKSTTLKPAVRKGYPTSGSVEINGRVSSLIELGAGFHPDLSGRENIYTNASIFGLTKKQIDERLDAIIEFSELAESIDNPVRTYSSGMYMRLAFSVAINVEADILLIDEILAVGDVSFQKKCFDRLKQIKKNGTTIVIVSHALEQIEEICDRCLWIEQGYIKEDGVPKNVHSKYLEYMDKERNELGTHSVLPDITEINYFKGRKVLRFGKRELKFTDKSMLMTSQKTESNSFNMGEDIAVKLFFDDSVKRKEKDAKNSKYFLGFRIYNSNNELCFGSNSKAFTDDKTYTLDDQKCAEICFTGMNILPGNYFLDIDVVEEKGDVEVVQDSIHEAFYFDITGDNKKQGIANIETRVSVS